MAQLAAARQGTHATKTRGEVRGGGKKPYRQKGTGRARQGSTRAPQYVGGGVVHGPQPRGYAQRTPKKMIAAALRGALSDRARDGRVYVVQELVPGDVPSTKTALAAINAVASTDKVLVVLHRDEDLSWLSLRNAVTVHALAVDQLNAYDVLVNDEVVFTEAALAAYVARAPEPRRRGSVEPSSARSRPTPSSLGLVEDAAEPTDAELAARVIGRHLRGRPEESSRRRRRGLLVRTRLLRRHRAAERLRHQGQRGLDEVPHARVALLQPDRCRGLVRLGRGREAAGFAAVQGDTGAEEEDASEQRQDPRPPRHPARPGGEREELRRCWTRTSTRSWLRRTPTRPRSRSPSRRCSRSTSPG